MNNFNRVFLFLAVMLSMVSMAKTQTPDTMSIAHSLIDSIVPPTPIQEDTITATHSQIVNDSIVKKAAEKEKRFSSLQNTTDKMEIRPWTPNPKYALISAIIPGGGQIYNRKYWKLPIVYGAFTACYYAITWNTRTFNEYRDAYRDFLSDDPITNNSWLAFAPYGAKAEDYAKYSQLKVTLKRGYDAFLRYRDMSYIITAGVYLLSILDAYVDAELYTFDISPDLTMRLTPDVQWQNITGKTVPAVGLNCNFTF